MDKIITAIGLMSGTSMDGIDVALIKSNGHEIISKDYSGYYPYPQKIKDRIHRLIENQFLSLDEIKETESDITNSHIEAVLDFIKKNNIDKESVDVIGFHGHTILHKPEKSITWQIGSSQELAIKTGINVVDNFRAKDIICGGQGAPLTPIYHHVLLKDHQKPVIVLNIGGVANITYLEDGDENNIVASDVCFGNAPMNDLVKEKIGKEFDKDGSLALKGKVNHKLAEAFLSLDYFNKPLPKSLDRNHFSELFRNELFREFYSIELEDSLATFSFILAKSLKMTIDTLGKKPKEVIICGGGRKNKSIMKNIHEVTKIKTTNMDQLNHDGDMIEAEAFAFLAIRHLLNLPISFKKTTGVLWEKRTAQTSKARGSSSYGGVFYHA